MSRETVKYHQQSHPIKNLLLLLLVLVSIGTAEAFTGLPSIVSNGGDDTVVVYGTILGDDTPSPKESWSWSVVFISLILVLGIFIVMFIYFKFHHTRMR